MKETCVSQTVVRASGCRQRELSAGEKSEDDDGADEEEEEEEEECDRSSEAVDGQEGAGACFTVDEDYDTELEPEGYVAGVLIKSEKVRVRSWAISVMIDGVRKLRARECVVDAPQGNKAA